MIKIKSVLNREFILGFFILGLLFVAACTPKGGPTGEVVFEEDTAMETPEKVAVVIPVVDVTPEVPEVVFVGIAATNPLNLAKSQGLGNNIIVTFDEAMNPTTVNKDTFVVQGQITSDTSRKVWTFNPTDALKSNSVYTITITKGAKGVSGNSLMKNFGWSFVTLTASSGSSGSSSSGSSSGSSSSSSGGSVPTPSPTPTPTVPQSVLAAVNLGSASEFVILTKSGISTTGTTLVTGNIGVSPIDSTAVTGFGLMADASDTFSTSSLVTGKVYAADYTSPTPVKMTTAVSDMETAYTDAAGRTNPTATELGAGDISGMTLTPGLYKWGTGVLINNGVTLDCQGNSNAVYIFQIAQTLTVGNGAIVTLSGSCQAKNIFWQTGGQTNLGTTSNFKGNILSQTDIVLNTGAVLNGRALAQTAVTLDASSVTVSN